MKNCTGCKYAEWQKTEAGKLHPSGDGHCRYEYKIPALPACMRWLGGGCITGGSINRRIDHKEHCMYYSK